MKIKVQEIKSKSTGLSIGVEFCIDDEQFFKLHDQSGLPGIRCGRIIPGIDETLKNNVLFEGDV